MKIYIYLFFLLNSIVSSIDAYPTYPYNRSNDKGHLILGPKDLGPQKPAAFDGSDTEDDEGDEGADIRMSSKNHTNKAPVEVAVPAFKNPFDRRDMFGNKRD